MPLVQLPRLTTTLRASCRGSDYFYDVEKAYLERKQILQSKRQKTSATLVGNSRFAQKIVRNWDKASSEIRRTYEQFLTAVLELMDGEISTEELHESAADIYDILHDIDANLAGSNVPYLVGKKEKLQTLLGHIASDASIQKTSLLANRLHKLQIEGSVLSVDQASIGNDYRCTDGDSPLEFGMDLEFHAPLTSLEDDDTEEDIFVEAEDIANSEAAVAGAGVNFALGYDLQSEHGSGNINLRWLKETCDQIVAAGGGSQLSGDEMATALCQVLKLDKAGDEIAGDLFDLIGDNGFEIIQKILQHRKELVDELQKGLVALKSERTSSSGVQSRMPSYGTQVSIQTESERQMDKLRRKEEKRQLKRGTGLESDHNLLAGVGGFSALLNASEKKGGVDNLIGKGDDRQSLSVKALPQGSVRKTFKGYEEVRVPATPTAQMRPEEKLVLNTIHNNSESLIAD